MIPRIKTDKHWTESIIDDDCGFEKFIRIADILQSNFNLTFTNKINDLDSIYWDFIYNESELVLFYNTYEGTTIFPKLLDLAAPNDNDMVVEIGFMLFQKLLELDWVVFDNGKTIGDKGSEGGTVIVDTENINGARITLERDCGNIPFSITLGIYGLMFHTHFESDLDNAKKYVLITKLRINKIFDLYFIPEGDRNDSWQNKHDKLIDEISDMTEQITTENKKPAANK